MLLLPLQFRYRDRYRCVPVTVTVTLTITVALLLPLRCRYFHPHSISILCNLLNYSISILCNLIRLLKTTQYLVFYFRYYIMVLYYMYSIWHINQSLFFPAQNIYIKKISKQRKKEHRFFLRLKKIIIILTLYCTSVCYITSVCRIT